MQNLKQNNRLIERDQRNGYQKRGGVGWVKKQKGNSQYYCDELTR